MRLPYNLYWDFKYIRSKMTLAPHKHGGRVACVDEYGNEKKKLAILWMKCEIHFREPNVFSLPSTGCGTESAVSFGMLFGNIFVKSFSFFLWNCRVPLVDIYFSHFVRSVVANFLSFVVQFVSGFRCDESASSEPFLLTHLIIKKLAATA